MPMAPPDPAGQPSRPQAVPDGPRTGAQRRRIAVSGTIRPRSKDPAGVMQEMRALFAVYQAICKIVGIAVNEAGVPPAQIRFPRALAAAKDSVAAFPLMTSQNSPSPRSC